MRILCVCEQGNKRSVYTRFLLNYKHEALSLGYKTNSKLTIKLLCEWADKILLAEPQMEDYLPKEYHFKIDKRFTIGPDNFPPSITGKLKRIVRQKLLELDYI